jgi:ferrochelatase
MNIRGKESFIDSGGKDFTFIPCINDNDLFIDFLKEFISE